MWEPPGKASAAPRCLMCRKVNQLGCGVQGAPLARGIDLERSILSQQGSAHEVCLFPRMETKTNQETLEAGSSTVAQPGPNAASARLKWGAIFGGGVAALGIAAMLYALGL